MNPFRAGGAYDYVDMGGWVADSAFAAKASFYFDDGPAQPRFDAPRLLAKPQPGTYLYVCGPKGFMDHVLATARVQGWPEEQLRYEFFTADVAARDTDESFEIQLASSGKVFTVPKSRAVIGCDPLFRRGDDVWHDAHSPKGALGLSCASAHSTAAAMTICHRDNLAL